MSPFKIAVTTFFGIAILASLIIFALVRGGSSKQTYDILVWGTISNEAYDAAFRASSLFSNKSYRIKYEKKDPSTFDTQFVEALAEGNGPDIVILREDYIYKQRNKLFVVPYKNYSERKFKDTFLEEGELFLTKEGVMAFPFIVDPMVMYWNRDIFSNALIPQPPKTWEEVTALIPKITKKDSNANVILSTLAMGEWRNINNAKEIISMLMLQAGTPIVERDERGYYSAISNSYGKPQAPGLAAVNFYTQFSNPTLPNYTWNRSLPSSLNSFLAGNLALYFGFASEIFSIQQKNSNLNFDVTYVPQAKDVARKTVFAHMYALALVKQSKSLAGAYTVAMAFTEPAVGTAIEGATNLPPVRRDLLASAPSDAYRSVFYNSALMSKSWLDPNPVDTSSVLREMIESITGGKSRTSEAVSVADREINDLLK